MRIVSGMLGGRTIEAPKGHRTHPMGDKIRGALFNALGDVEGLSVLDAFCGSGALAIEAISRGAHSAIAIDTDKAAALTAVQNMKALGIDRWVKVIRANVSSWSDHNPATRFDLVIADPPYDAVHLPTLQKVATHCAHSGLYVLSLPPAAVLPDLPGFELLTCKTYGDARLYFYRRIS